MLIFRLVFWCLGGKNVLLQIAHTIIAGVLGNYTGKNIFYQGIGRWQDFYRFNFSDLFGRKPASLSFEQAAAMPLTTITAWEALFDRLGADGSLPAEDNRRTVLIIGGAGGGGSIAIQLAKKRAGLDVIATASREDSAAWCRKLGADEIINHHEPFAEEFKRIGADEADYILCFNSTELHIQNMADVIRPQGKICTIVEAKDNRPVNINLFQGKSVGFMWELMFTRSMFKTPDMPAQHDLLNEAGRMLDEGHLKTTMTESYGPLSAENLRRAHGKIESGMD